jgi:hypothetical protein
LAVGVVILAQQRFHFGGNRLPYGSLGMGVDQVGYLVSELWIEKRNCRIVARGGVLLI